MTIPFLYRTCQAGKEAGTDTSHRFTQRALVACPLAFIGFVAVYSRANWDNYEVPSGTPAQDAAVLAYAPYVREANDVLKKSHHPVDRARLLAIANAWNKAADTDVLNPLFPVSFEDNPLEGVRGQILRTKSLLVAALARDAGQLAKKGEVSQSVDETLLAMRLSESLKYSSLNTVFQASEEERRQAALLKRLAPSMDPATKAEVRDCLAQVSASFDNLDAITRMSRVQYYDWMERTTHDPISIEDVHRTELVTKKIASDPGSRDVLGFIRSSIMDSPVDDGPEYLSELRLAWRAEKSNEESIKELASQI